MEDGRRGASAADLLEASEQLLRPPLRLVRAATLRGGDCELRLDGALVGAEPINLGLHLL